MVGSFFETFIGILRGFVFPYQGHIKDKQTNQLSLLLLQFVQPIFIKCLEDTRESWCVGYAM